MDFVMQKNGRSSVASSPPRVRIPWALNNPRHKPSHKAWQLWAAISVFAVALSACSTTPEIVACAAADWVDLGERDGAAGETKGQFNDMADKCGDRGLLVDRAAYDKGYQIGLAQYCSPQGGFAAGFRGENYEDVCPMEAEVSFLTAYGFGERLMRLEKDEKDARKKLSKARSDLDHYRFSLKDAQSRLRNPYASGPEVSAAHRDIDFFSSEVARLQQEVPNLTIASDEAESVLEKFKTELATTGLSADAPSLRR